MGICTGRGMDTGMDIDIHTGTGMDTGTDTMQTFAQAHTSAEVQAQEHHRFGYMLEM